jgi:uncharacterized protein (TIGR03086 family)
MTTETLERAFASTRQVLGNVKPDQLSDPSPCQSWTVREVINHVIGGAFWFAGSVNEGKAPPIPDTDFTGGDMGATYDDGIKQSVAAFDAPGAMEKMIELPFGTFPGAFFINLATTDAFTHGWDLAKATGQSTDLDPEVATQLLEGARAFIQPAFRGEDGKAPFGPEQQPPPNATAADKLAAFLGRVCER